MSRLALGHTQPPSQWVPWVISLGVKLLGCEADHSLPSSTKVKNAWIYTSTPQYAFTMWCSVKKLHRYNFTFTCISNNLSHASATQPGTRRCFITTALNFCFKMCHEEDPSKLKGTGTGWNMSTPGPCL
jgi:hypothetical protein